MQSSKHENWKETGTTTSSNVGYPFCHNYKHDNLSATYDTSEVIDIVKNAIDVINSIILFCKCYLSLLLFISFFFAQWNLLFNFEIRTFVVRLTDAEFKMKVNSQFGVSTDIERRDTANGKPTLVRKPANQLQGFCSAAAAAAISCRYLRIRIRVVE